MPLFDVPGWSIQSEPVSASKKRKRPKASTSGRGGDAPDIAAATVNIEKLMHSLDSVLAAESKGSDGKGKGKAKAVILGEDEDGDDGPRPKKRKEGGKKVKATQDGERESGPLKKKAKGEGIADKPPKEKKTKVPLRKPTPDLVPPTPGPSKKNKDKKKEKLTDDAQIVSKSSTSPKAIEQNGMTVLQAKMKNSLDGARFRWINEELYKSDSIHAYDMMRKDPKIFEEYHTGFRHQVQSWPTNPVEHYINQLTSYPEKTVIADLGCGDATLAKALIPKGMTVLSFDLVSDGAYVVEADVSSKLPLPGSEGIADKEGKGEGQVVDVVVCALSLMGTNWPGTIREAWRVLKPEGELKIAEVASRFTDVDSFVTLVGRLGFRLTTKDTSNSHFTLFEFKKKAKKAVGPKEWEKVLEQGEVLKPCEYKRR